MIHPLLLWLTLSLALHHLVILDEQFLFTRDGTVQRFLVCWRGRPDFDCTWITREELQQLDLALLEAYLDTLATTSSLPPITWTYDRRRRRHVDLVSLWLDGVYSNVTWFLWALLDGVEFLPPQGSWCGHHMMAHLWRLSLSFMLSLFGFILSIRLVFEIVRIIVLVFEIV